MAKARHACLSTGCLLLILGVLLAIRFGALSRGMGGLSVLTGPQEEGKGEFVGVEEAKLYHRPGCALIQHSKATEKWSSQLEAVKAGRTYCKKCILDPIPAAVAHDKELRERRREAGEKRRRRQKEAEERLKKKKKEN